MKTVKELWNDLFDISLEKYQNEDETIRNFFMILHILKLEYKKISEYVLEMKQRNIAQTKEISEYKQKQCDCKITRTPLKTLSENCNEKTPKKLFFNQNINTSFDISDSDDIFNHQITDVDVNLSKENDNSLFIDDSFENFNITTSPTLNKDKKKRLSRKKHKHKDTKDVVVNTPTPKLNESKKLKQAKLSLSSLASLSKTKNCTATRSTSINSDSDETLFIPITSVQTKNISLERTLPKKIENESKKPRLDDSYDIIPEKQKDSPNYVYKREAVRKKSERMQLQGWNCPDCEKYYSTFKNKLSDEEIKKLMNACSRHRDKFNPNILTPQGFWNPDFSPTQESIAFHIE